MKTKFLVADEIRQEASGKQTILGLFADDVVVAHTPPKSARVPEGAPSGLERLAFLVNMSELQEGAHKVTGQILDPSGTPYGEWFPLNEVNVAPGRSHTIMIEMKPFILQGAGTYTLLLKVDGEEFKHPFEVRLVNE